MKFVEKLASNCKITFGYSRSLLCDLQRQKWWVIPTELAELIDQSSFDKVRSNYSDFYDLLIEQEMIIAIPEIEQKRFTPLNLNYYSIQKIENATLDWKQGVSNYPILEILTELEESGCKHIEIRFYNNPKSFNFILEVFENFQFSTFETIDLILNYDYGLKHIKRLDSIKSKNVRLNQITLFSSPDTIPDILKDFNYLIFLKTAVSDCTHCGHISKLYFSANIQHYSLSHSYNTCLYKKIGIDINGLIKNCPSAKTDFGKVGEAKLKDVVKRKSYQFLGGIKKEDIIVCKDCEFRNVCSDCRIYIDDSNNPYSKPAKCSYNPYICLWEGEKGYKTIEECGITLDEKGMVIDHKKLELINQQIWGD